MNLSPIPISGSSSIQFDHLLLGGTSIDPISDKLDIVVGHERAVWWHPPD
jgi:hypothetical protein